MENLVPSGNKEPIDVFHHQQVKDGMCSNQLRTFWTRAYVFQLDSDPVAQLAFGKRDVLQGRCAKEVDSEHPTGDSRFVCGGPFDLPLVFLLPALLFIASLGAHDT
jgi:hypothetical protein